MTQLPCTFLQLSHPKRRFGGRRWVDKLTTHFCRLLLQLQWSSGQNGKFIKCPPTSRWKWDITWANGERCLENLFSKIVTTCSIRPLASSTRVGVPNFLTTTQTSLSEYSVLLYLKEKDLIFAEFNFFQLTWWNYHPRSSNWEADNFFLISAAAMERFVSDWMLSRQLLLCPLCLIVRQRRADEQ